MRWPGTIPADVRSSALVTPIDHLPTYCSLAGIPTPAAADGVDLSEVLLGGAGPRRDDVLLMNYVASYANFKSGGKRPEWRAVRTEERACAQWLDNRPSSVLVSPLPTGLSSPRARACSSSRRASSTAIST